MGDKLFRELAEKFERIENPRVQSGLDPSRAGTIENIIASTIQDIHKEDHGVTNNYFKQDIMTIFEKVGDPEILIAYGQASATRDSEDTRYSQKLINILMRHLKQLK